MNQKQHLRVCVVVPVFHRLPLTIRFLDAFQKSTYRNYQIVIYDGGFNTETQEKVAADYPEVKLIKEKDDVWWTEATNGGVKYAIQNGFDYVLTINQDAVVEPDYLEKLVACAQTRPEGIWGSAIMAESTDKIWAFGVSPRWAYGFQETKPKHNLFTFNFWQQELSNVIAQIEQPYEVEAINGDGTLVPVGVFEKVGLYDQFWCPQNHADTEFVMRARRRGIKAYICPDAVLYNHDVETSAIKNTWQRIFNKKSDKYWKPILKLYISYAPLHLKPFFFWFYLSHLRFVPGKVIRKLTNKK